MLVCFHKLAHHTIDRFKRMCTSSIVQYPICEATKLKNRNTHYLSRIDNGNVHSERAGEITTFSLCYVHCQPNWQYNARFFFSLSSFVIIVFIRWISTVIVSRYAIKIRLLLSFFVDTHFFLLLTFKIKKYILWANYELRFFCLKSASQLQDHRPFLPSRWKVVSFSWISAQNENFRRKTREKNSFVAFFLHF